MSSKNKTNMIINVPKEIFQKGFATIWINLASPAAELTIPGSPRRRSLSLHQVATSGGAMYRRG